MSDDELDQRFREAYGRSQTEATVDAERAVIGADFGANGYTTLAQAEDLGRRLALRPGARLLDIGCGRGWPGLFLAKTTGCDAVLTDVPEVALRGAAARAHREALAPAIVASSAAALPFAARSFDAIVHTDVLC